MTPSSFLFLSPLLLPGIQTVVVGYIKDRAYTRHFSPLSEGFCPPFRAKPTFVWKSACRNLRSSCLLEVLQFARKMARSEDILSFQIVDDEGRPFDRDEDDVFVVDNIRNQSMQHHTDESGNVVSRGRVVRLEVMSAAYSKMSLKDQKLFVQNLLAKLSISLQFETRPCTGAPVARRGLQALDGFSVTKIRDSVIAIKVPVTDVCLAHFKNTDVVDGTFFYSSNVYQVLV